MRNNRGVTNGKPKEQREERRRKEKEQRRKGQDRALTGREAATVGAVVPAAEVIASLGLIEFGAVLGVMLMAGAGLGALMVVTVVFTVFFEEPER